MADSDIRRRYMDIKWTALEQEVRVPALALMFDTDNEEPALKAGIEATLQEIQAARDSPEKAVTEQQEEMQRLIAAATEAQKAYRELMEKLHKRAVFKVRAITEATEYARVLAAKSIHGRREAAALAIDQTRSKKDQIEAFQKFINDMTFRHFKIKLILLVSHL